MKEKVAETVADLVEYGLQHGIVSRQDRVYTENRLLEALGLSDFDPGPGTYPRRRELEEMLSVLTGYAANTGTAGQDTPLARDLFDAKLMGCLTPPPSVLIEEFRSRYSISPKCATDWFYKFGMDTDYIRKHRIKKDIKWKSSTAYGVVDITINLSKPEKDPGDIAAAAATTSSEYPKCLLCRENEGYAGHALIPARQNHRLIPITLDREQWYFQYSPYVYYNEHCIVLHEKHIPMKVDRSTFRKLADFISMFPHYFIGSNADLPIVGGSILSHEHFQGGNYKFAIEEAPVAKRFLVRGFPGVEAGIVKWPLSVIRLQSFKAGPLVGLADHILGRWRAWSDEEAGIFAQTGGICHNTVTPIMRKRGDRFELDLALRNNRADKAHPLGIFHPHAELHHIKKENIGLIEVMGLAVLPPRLKGEIDLLKRFILTGGDVRSDPRIRAHADWIDEISSRYGIDEYNVDRVIEDEISKVFVQVLEHAGVFKWDIRGRVAFERFIGSLDGPEA
jgi:UDPglucose--hexose-1-phosphate uridylyltransferase